MNPSHVKALPRNISGEVRQRQTQVMLVLNITPDSFSDGGEWYNTETEADIEALLEAVENAIHQGFDIKKDILDIGGESTRPGALTVAEDVEIARVVPVIQAIYKAFPKIRISVDTRKSSVAKAAIDAGASIINDVSGFRFDVSLLEIAAKTDCGLVLMHSIGTPETMQTLAKEGDCYPNGIVLDVINFFEQQIALAKEFGIAESRIILDPGFGFGKTLDHNLALLNGLSTIKATFPKHSLLVGTSRKSFLTLGQPDLDLATKDALTVASVFEAIHHGQADIIRIHNMNILLPVLHLAEACQAGT